MLVDGTGSAPLHQPVVVILDDSIQAVGRAEQVPLQGWPEAEVLDASDLCILPGLVDAHVHLVCSAGDDPLSDLLRDDADALLLRATHNAQVALCAGITTLRDCGGPRRTVLSLRNAINAGIIMGPHILASGIPITITGGQSYWLGLEADTTEELLKAARTMAREGADFFKVMATGGAMTPGSNPRAPQYSTAELAVVVAEGQRLGKKVAVHVHGTAGIRNAVAAGVDTLEHCSWLAPVDGLEFDEHLVGEIARRGIHVDPTLMTGYRALTNDQGLTADQQRPYALRQERLSCYRKMIRAGVKFLAGTDAGVAHIPPDSLAQNIALLVHELGISPMAAIQAATQRSAEALGLVAETGTIQPGKRADLILVEGNPTQDTDALRRVRWVVCNGRVMARDKQLLLDGTGSTALPNRT